MAAIAGGSRGPLHVVRRIELGPPVRSVRDHVGTPHLGGHFPWRRLRKIIVADFCEVALLPDASVNECNLIFRELGADVVGCQIWSNRVWMFARIAHDVGHRRFLPAIVNLLMTFLTCRGTNIVSGIIAPGTQN